MSQLLQETARRCYHTLKGGTERERREGGGEGGTGRRRGEGGRECGRGMGEKGRERGRRERRRGREGGWMEGNQLLNHPTIMGLELVLLQKLSSPYLPPPPHTLTKCRSFNSCTILAAWLSMGTAFGLVRNSRKRHRAAVCFTPSVVSLCREYTELSIWLTQICILGPHNISAYYSVDVQPVLSILLSRCTTSTQCTISDLHIVYLVL